MDSAEKLYDAIIKSSGWMGDRQKKLDSLSVKLDPRKRFNLWRNSKTGQEWRDEKFREQLGCCAICGEKMHPRYIHIDHIEPISKRPDLACSLTNLRLTHPLCNLKKATKY